jgi:electron transfer flavoprotein alpha/beta subunit
MNIIVCIKQVPDTAEVKIDRETNTLIREGVPSIVNPFDENALEAALQIKEKTGGKITVITMGPPQAEEALRKALAMGADEAILLSDRAFAGADTWATSYTLASAVKKIGSFDLVLCGKQAIDGDTAQVGPGIAENLNIPLLAYVRKIEIEGSKIKVEQVMEEGYEVLEAQLPVMVTVLKEINQPRHPSLKGVLKAKKAEIPVWKAEAVNADPNNIGLKGSPTQVVKIFTPPARDKGEFLTGSSEEMAASLFDKLKLQKII